MRYKIHNLAFVLWRGGPPRLTQQIGSQHTKPGADGVGEQSLGRVGQPFEVQLVSWHATFAAAEKFYARALGLVYTGQKRLVYENLDYSKVHKTKYSIQHVDRVEQQTCVRLLSAADNLNYSGGTRLILRVTMTPHRDDI